MEKAEEAERLLGVAEQLLSDRDLSGSREFAILAQETEPLLEGSDQILAVIDVLFASDTRSNNHLDWYAILQVDRRSDDIDLIKKQYRRLALLLHPDKNGFSHADRAFKLVAEAWAILSDPSKKSLYDKELGCFSPVVLSAPGWAHQEKLPVRRVGAGSGGGGNQGFDFSNNGTAGRDAGAHENSRQNPSTFWTACPYCYLLCEYHKLYEGCCLRCQNCERSFHGVSIPTLPPLVAGQEAYYCCWGFFPLTLATANSAGKEAATPSRFPNWTPTVPESGRQSENGCDNAEPMAATKPVAKTAKATGAVSNGISSGSGSSGRKRGRPRKAPAESFIAINLV